MLPEPLSTAPVTAAPRGAPVPREATLEERRGAGRSFSDEVAEDPAATADAAEDDPAAADGSPGRSFPDTQIPALAGLAFAAGIPAQAPAQAGGAVVPPAEARGTTGVGAVLSAETAGTAGVAARPAGGNPAADAAAAAPDSAAGITPRPAAPPGPEVPGPMPGQISARAPDSGSTPAPSPAHAPSPAPVAAASYPEAAQPGGDGSADPAASRTQARPESPTPGSPAGMLPGMPPATGRTPAGPSADPRANGGTAPVDGEGREAAPAPARSLRARQAAAEAGTGQKRALSEPAVSVRDAGDGVGRSTAGPDGGAVAIAGAERPVPSAQPTPDAPRSGDARPAAPQTLGAQIVEGIRHASDGSVELSLSPEELGKVRLTLRGNEASLHVAIQADRPETESLLRRHIGLLQQEFRDLGYGGISFDFGSRQDRPAPFADRAEDTGPPAGAEVATIAAGAAQTPRAPALVQGRGLDLRL